MGILPDTQNCGLRMHRGCRERFPHHRGLAILTLNTVNTDFLLDGSESKHKSCSFGKELYKMGGGGGGGGGVGCVVAMLSRSSSY